MLVLDSNDVMFFGHGSHSIMPRLSAYFPASQEEQFVSVVMKEFSPWYLPTLQSKHSVLPKSEYFPASHAVQFNMPEALANVPLGQSVQSAVSVMK